jgi:hypothetical protein
MIEIITEHVEMPEFKDRRFQKQRIQKQQWNVFDTETKTIRYKGKFEDVALACHNLNKEYYRRNPQC